MGQVKRGIVGKARHQAALLINGSKERRIARLLQIVQELGDLLRAFQIFAKDYHAAHRVLRQSLAHGIRQFGHAVRLGIVDLVLRLAQVQGIGSNKKELPHLLFQRHLLQQLLHEVRLRGGLFRGCCLRGLGLLCWCFGWLGRLIGEYIFWGSRTGAQDCRQNG